MNTSVSPHVVAWLRDLDGGQGVFAQALDWAGCFGWPLRVVAPAMNNVTAPALVVAGADGVSATGPSTREEAWFSRCDAECRRRNVAWELASSGNALDTLGASGLHVIGCVGAGRAGEGRSPLRRLVTLEEAAIMLCPPTGHSASRLLAAVHGWYSTRHFLNVVIRIARRLQAEVVVLTMAGFDAEARRQEAVAEECFRGQGIPVIFDAVIGCDTFTAVSRVAQWRRCSHVVLQRDKPSWWTRWRGEMIERLASLAESISLVALPPSWQVNLAGKL